MRKQILTIGLVALVASSSLYAFSGCDKDSNCSSHKMMSKSHMKLQNNGMHKVMSIVSDMDLTSSQWMEIKKTMLDMKKDRFDDRQNLPTITFNKDGSFNKEEFIKERISFSKEMIETQSKMIEKVVSILNKSQKEILIAKLNDDKSIIEKGCKKWN